MNRQLSQRFWLAALCERRIELLQRVASIPLARFPRQTWPGATIGRAAAARWENPPFELRFL